jgi:hypothetical protein
LNRIDKGTENVGHEQDTDECKGKTSGKCEEKRHQQNAARNSETGLKRKVMEKKSGNVKRKSRQVPRRTRSVLKTDDRTYRSDKPEVVKR